MASRNTSGKLCPARERSRKAATSLSRSAQMRLTSILEMLLLSLPWLLHGSWRLQEAERHPGKGADGSPCVRSVLVPASAKLDDPSVERL